MNKTIKQQSLFWGIVLFAIMFIFMASAKTTQTIQYYQSEWTTIAPMSNVAFEHGLGQLPSSLDVFVSMHYASANLRDPTTVVPYRDLGDACLKIGVITPQTVIVNSICENYQIIRVDALLIIP